GPAAITSAAVNSGSTAAQVSVNRSLISTSYRTRDFSLETGSGKTSTRMEAFYIQDDFKITPNVQFNFGLRWDYHQSYAGTQTNNEVTAGFEYEIVKDLALGARGIYRNQGSVIEDGSFNDGATYFLFNPGESLTERVACNTPGIGCFGRARRYYRALEFTATKRFSQNYQFIASYVHAGMIGD